MGPRFTKDPKTEDLKIYIKAMDEKAMDLAIAIDTMQSAVELLVNALKTQTVETDILQRVSENACDLLRQLKGSIVINRNRTLSTILNFLDFVTSGVDLKTMKKPFALEIRKYLKELGISCDGHVCEIDYICEESRSMIRKTFRSKGKSAQPDERTRLNKESKNANVYGGKVKQSTSSSDYDADEVYLLPDKISEYESELSNAQFKMKEKQDELNQIVLTLKNRNEQIDTLQKSSEALKEDMDRKEKQSKKTIEDLQKLVTSLEDENRKLGVNNKTLTMELEKMQMMKALKVQVYSQRQSETMSAVEKEIICHLEKRIENKRSNVKFVQCATQGDVDQSLPTLLLCINASRLGTEASNILHGFKANSKMALVIVHHKDIHALPSQASSRVLVGQEFKDLGGIFDVAFLADKGIHNCDMNEENLSKCVDFITNCW